MSALDAIMGRAKAGTLHGIGVGPGDASLMTLRAAGLIRTVDTLAYFAKAGNKSNARRIAAPLIEAGRKEMPLHYPVTTELSVADPGYKQLIRAFYAEAAAAIAERLRAGESIGLLAEGDPFFYGSFMHMWRRLAADFPVEVVPGVTGFSGCSARAGAPLTWGDDVLTVLPGTLDEATLLRRLAETDAAVIMKIGRNIAKARRAITAANLIDRAIYVERGSMPGERIAPLAEVMDESAPYFSMILIPGQGRRL
jgi:precorrin-2/cobalt-factor-2 C20-methyltransferase